MTVPTPLADLAGSTVEEWEQVLRVNVIGTFLVSQAALEHLRASGDGWIVNITSLAGVRQGGSSLPYATSKAAVNHLTTLMAKFTGPEVRVNAVAPGLVDTPWTVGERWDAVREMIKANNPLRRSGTPDDITEFNRDRLLPQIHTLPKRGPTHPLSTEPGSVTRAQQPRRPVFARGDEVRSFFLGRHQRVNSSTSAFAMVRSSAAASSA
jgi:hypothetical protein